jgi:glycosyltransferase involved in cell wall biosynthesis
MKKILVIPHIPSEEIRVREKEIATELAKKHDVHYVKWTTSHSQNIYERTINTLKDLCKPTTTLKESNLTIVRIRMLHRPLWCAKYFNKYSLAKYINSNKFDIVLNAAVFAFSISKKNRKFKYIFDFVDLPTSHPRSRFGKFIIKHTKDEVLKADVVIACSRGLIDYVKKHYDKDAVFIPNGASLNVFENIAKSDIEDLRNRYGLKNQFVIGYIGNFGPWSNLDFIFKVFQDLKQKVDNAVLLFVGSGTEIAKWKERACEKDVIFVNAVPPSEVHNYFKLIDVGILPSPKTEFRDMSFPIKIIEYTAAKKIVVSAPLQEVVRLNFPNVIIAKLTKGDWVRALKKTHRVEWEEKWNPVIQPYDWKIIIQRLEKVFTTIIV